MAIDIATINRQIFDEVWNKRNLDVADQLIADEFVTHDPRGATAQGLEAYKEYVRSYTTAFPDLHFTVDEAVADDTTVATRWTATGTHRGPLYGIPPTGRAVKMSGVVFSKFKDGKFTVSWSFWDSLSLMKQLGLAPSTESEQAA
jgi:steroid delta-isomerase-like uncharacterized protein